MTTVTETSQQFAERFLSRVTAAIAPRSLYLSRKLLNAKEVALWYLDQGVDGMKPNQMHVTIAFSRAPVNWMKLGGEGGSIGYGTDSYSGHRTVVGGPRMMERFDGGAVVLCFACDDFAWRNNRVTDLGGTWDFPTYQPHVTLCYDPEGKLDLSKVQPYIGPLVFGQELFAEVNENWKEENYSETASLEEGNVKDDLRNHHGFTGSRKMTGSAHKSAIHATLAKHGFREAHKAEGHSGLHSTYHDAKSGAVVRVYHSQKGHVNAVHFSSLEEASGKYAVGDKVTVRSKGGVKRPAEVVGLKGIVVTVKYTDKEGGTGKTGYLMLEKAAVETAARRTDPFSALDKKMNDLGAKIGKIKHAIGKSQPNKKETSSLELAVARIREGRRAVPLDGE